MPIKSSSLPYKKTTNVSHGFFELFPQNNFAREPILAPNLCWRFCG